MNTLAKLIQRAYDADIALDQFNAENGPEDLRAEPALRAEKKRLEKALRDCDAAVKTYEDNV